jgi:dihydroflavonol-4-reductase
VDEALEVVRGLTGRPRHVMWIPAGVVRGAAPLTVLARLGRRTADPPVCPAVVRTLLHGHRYDGTKAARDLGVGYRPFEETVSRTLDWARDQGLLGAGRRG